MFKVTQLKLGRAGSSWTICHWNQYPQSLYHTVLRERVRPLVLQGEESTPAALRKHPKTLPNRELKVVVRLWGTGMVEKERA